MEESITNYLNRYVPFTDSEMRTLIQHLTVKTFRKKDFLLQENDICRYNFFITSGLVRSYYIDDKGTERITQFAIENWWITNLESFVRQTPSSVYIQAIEPTTVYCLSKEHLDALYVHIPKLERVFRILTENMLIAINRRNNVYLKLTSADRYQHFVEFLPDFVQRIPQYMVASYLEITPEHLSFLRKQNANTIS